MPIPSALLSAGGSVLSSTPGGAEGDRRLEIDKSGKAQRYKFGPERKPIVKQEFTVIPADAAGQPALITSRKALITVSDQLTVVLYGDKYKRVPN